MRRTREQASPGYHAESLEPRLLLSQGPVTLYHFDEGTGSAGAIIHDASPSGNDATLTGPVTWDSAPDSSPSAIYLSGDGAGGVVRSSRNLGQWLGSSATLGLWVLIPGETGGGSPDASGGIIGVAAANPADSIYWGWLDATGRLALQTGTGPAVKTRDPLNDGGWHYVTFTRDAQTGEQKLYVNGLIQASAFGPAGTIASPFNLIGAIQHSGGVDSYLPVALDDLSIYDRVLTAGEVRQMRSPPSAPPAAPSNLSASYFAGYGMHLSWTDNASNEAGNRIERSYTGLDGSWSEVAVTNAPGNTWDDTSVVANQRYYYRIRAYNLAGSSDYSNLAIGSTVPPVLNVAGTPGPDTIFLKRDLNRTNLQVWVNSPTPGQGAATYNMPLSTVGGVNISANAGDDLITLDFSFGNPLAGGVSIDGGDGNDVLVLKGMPATSDVWVAPATALVNSTLLSLSSVQAVQLAGVAGGAVVLNALSVTGSGRVFLPIDSESVLDLKRLSIDPGAALDLGDNDLILRSDADHRAAMLAAIQQMLASARGGPGASWSGSGIGSSAAPANGRKGLAAIINERITNDGTPVAIHTSFGGQNVDTNCILVSWTWNGDIDLNRQVNADDYYQIDSGFLAYIRGNSQNNYASGDIDYNGAINADDYYLVDSAYLAQRVPGQLRTISFDNGISGELSLDFSRDSATIDPLGNAVASNQPRYDQPQVLTAAGQWRAETAPDGSQNFLGSGVDHDGTTPLLVTYAPLAGVLRFFRGSLSAPALVRNIARTGSLRDALVGTTIQESSYAYTPFAGVVCNGLLVLLCERKNVANAQTEGISVIATQASSSIATDWFAPAQVWKVGDVQPLGNNSSYFGLARGREWAMSNYFPADNSGALLGAWFPFTDYAFQGNPPAPGGQVGLFYASRSSVGAQWQTRPLRLIYDSVQAEGTQSGAHYHSAGLVVRGEDRVDVIVSRGDSGQARIQRFFVDDPAGDIRNNYAASASITADLAHQGGRGRPVNQFGAVAPGPQWGSLLVGGDEGNGAVYLFTPSADRTGAAEGRFEQLYGSPFFDRDGASNVNINGLWITTSAPERGTPYVARMTPSPGAPGGAANATASPSSYRILFSADGLHWGSLAGYPPDCDQSAAPFVFGDRVGVTYHGAYLGSIYSTSVPTQTVGRALLVGDGGRQYARYQPVGDGQWSYSGMGAGNSLTWLSKVDGKWVWPAGTPNAGQAIDPQPPSLGPVAMITAGGTSTALGTHSVSGGVADVPIDGPLAVRWYVMPVDATMSLQYASSAGGSFVGTWRNLAMQSAGEWMPIITYDRPTSSGATPAAPYAASTMLTSSAPERFLIAMDSAVYSQGPPGYAMAPVAVGADAPVLPPESVTVGGFNCLATDWTIGVSFHMPSDGWDTSIGAISSLPLSRVPLFAAWGSDNEYVSVVADLANKRILGRICSGGELVDTITLAYDGGDPNVWLERGDFSSIVVSQYEGRIRLTAYLGGPRQLGRLTGSSAHALRVGPTQVRFAFSQQSPELAIDSVAVDERAGYKSRLVDDLLIQGAWW